MGVRVWVVGAVCALLVFPSPTEAAAPRPDLGIAGVRASAASVTAGGTLRVKATVRNAGVRVARRSRTGFFLSRDARRSANDVGLGSAVRTRALKPGARVTVVRTVVVPPMSGRSRLLACADVGRRVRERREANNCRAAKAAVRVLPRPPVAAGAAVTAVEDTPWVIVLEATDPDTCDLQFSVDVPPGHGRLTSLTARPCFLGGDMATVIYTPARDYAGGDALVFGVADGTGGRSSARVAIAVAGVNDPPRITPSAGAAAYTEGTDVAIAPTVTVSDVDSPTLTGATVKVTGVAGEDELLFTSQSGITATFNGGSLTLTGVATLAQYTAALRSVRYHNASEAPSAALRTISIAVSDGRSSSAAATRGLTVTPVNDPPLVTTTEGAALYPAGGAPVVIDSGVKVTDPDNTDLERATVRVTDRKVGDTLAVPPQAGITQTFDPETGTLPLTGPASLPQFEAALASVTFDTESPDPPGSTRTIEFTVYDGEGTSSATRSVEFTPPPPPP